MRSGSWIALSLALVAGCMKTSERYCAQNPGAPECAGGGDASTACATSDQCTSATAPVCEPGSMTCVQCTDNQAAACDDATPVCGDDFRCRGCEDHAECPSMACLPSGACATDEDTAFIDAGASGGNDTCTRQQPCAAIADALALTPRRPNIVVRGTHTTNLVLNDYAVTLVGIDGARLAVTSGRAIEVDGTQDVTIAGLAIGPQSGDASGRAIYASETYRGTLTLRQIAVRGHGLTSISVEGGSLVLERSVITQNDGGGVRLESGATSFQIRNNFIFANGAAVPVTSPSAVGGIAVEMGPTGTIEHNTIYDNGSAGIEFYAGIGCKAGPTSYVRGNILVSNLIAGPSPSVGNLDGACTAENNFDGVAADVKFVRATALPIDLHLTAETPATIRDALASCALPIDIDGQARPQGSGCDLGADEYIGP